MTSISRLFTSGEIASGMIPYDITSDSFYNIIYDIFIGMPKIQQGPDGRHTVTLPSDIVALKHWEKGGKIEFAEVDNRFIYAAPGDLVVRYTPPPTDTKKKK